MSISADVVAKDCFVSTPCLKRYIGTYLYVFHVVSFLKIFNSNHHVDFIAQYKERKLFHVVIEFTTFDAKRRITICVTVES